MPRKTGELVGKGGVVNTDSALFQLLDHYPLAAIMLIIGDGGATALSGLQALMIVAALHFVLIMATLCLSLYLDLRHDPMTLRAQIGIELVEEAVVQGVQTHGKEFGLVTQHSETDTVAQDDEKDQIPVRVGLK